MWLSDGVLTTIAGFLDFKSLNRLSLTDKSSNRALTQEHKKQSLPYVIDYIKHRIMEERRRAPHNPFTMIVRDEHLIRFSNLDYEETGILTLFSTEIEGNSLEVRAAYANSDEGFMHPVGLIQAVITPSIEHPIRQGKVVISRNRTTGNETTIEYTNRLNPRLALEWCPLFMPDELLAE